MADPATLVTPEVLALLMPLVDAAHDKPEPAALNLATCIARCIAVQTMRTHAVEMRAVAALNPEAWVAVRAAEKAAEQWERLPVLGEHG